MNHTSTDYSASEFVGRITVSEDISREMVDDILCTAIDYGYGGSHYWIQNHDGYWTGSKDTPEYTFEFISRGGYIVFTPDEDDTEYTLTLEKFLVGLELACKHFGMTAQALYDDHDATIADVVLQYALFGEIVYG